MNQILLLPLTVLPTSHLLLPIIVFPISYLLLRLNILPVSHLLLLLLDVVPISLPNLLLLLQLLYPKTPRNGSKPRWSKRKQKRKRSMLHPTRTTETRKRAVSKKECTLEAEVLVDLHHGSTPFDIFQTVTGMNELLEIIVIKKFPTVKQQRIKWRDSLG